MYKNTTTKTKKIIDSIHKQIESEDVDESYKASLTKIEDDLEGELPEEIRIIGRLFFLKGYRASEENNLKILKLISELQKSELGNMTKEH